MANPILLIPLSALYAFVCIGCLIEYRRRAGSKEKAVYLPGYILWIGAIGGGLFTAFTWLAAKQDGSIGLTVCFGLFSLLGMLLMQGWKNCFITYNKAGFTRKNLIGMRQHFTYSQVTGWCCNRRNPVESSLYANGKKISFNLMSKSGADFLTAVHSGYRKTHHRQNLPELPELQKERGGFRAHVYNPGEYLAIFIMLLVFILGFGAWVVIDTLRPIGEQDGAHYTLVFSAWEIQEDSLILTAQQAEEVFIVDGCEAHLSGTAELIAKCDGKTPFSVWAKRFDPDDSEPYFRVYALSSGGEVYRSFEDSTAYKREELPLFLGIFGAFLAVVLAFSAFIYAVGSNPKKFPRWVVYACFKRNAIDI